MRCRRCGQLCEVEVVAKDLPELLPRSTREVRGLGEGILAVALSVVCPTKDLPDRVRMWAVSL